MTQPSQLLANLEKQLRVRGDAVAVSGQSGTLSFRELSEQSSRIARRLMKDAGGTAGQRIGVLAPADLAWATAFVGILRSGAGVVPLSPLHPPAEQHRISQTARLDRLLVASELADPDSALQCELRVDGIEEMLALDSGAAWDGKGPQRPPNVTASSGAVMLFTSGTTGQPKGVQLSHGNLWALVDGLRTAWEFSEDDRLLHSLPLHHLHGIAVAFMVCLWSGGSTKFLRRFQSQALFSEFAEATVWMAVPAQHQTLLDAAETASKTERQRWAADARTLRLVTSGSAALSSKMGARVAELFGQYPLERYGMTEVGIVLSNPHEESQRQAGSCGRPVGGAEIRIVDEQGIDVAEGESGEIWIRGPSVFAAYFDAPEATAKGFAGSWFRSGDTAKFRADGYVQILGRTSVDIIKSADYKLSALEIEAVLKEHPAVREISVVGVPDEKWGEVVVAAVVPAATDSVELSVDSLASFAKDELARYKLPRRLVQVEELPKNALGKVMKTVLRAEIEARLLRTAERKSAEPGSDV